MLKIRVTTNYRNDAKYLFNERQTLKIVVHLSIKLSLHWSLIYEHYSISTKHIIYLFSDMCTVRTTGIPDPKRLLRTRYVSRVDEAQWTETNVIQCWGG